MYYYKIGSTLKTKLSRSWDPRATVDMERRKRVGTRRGVCRWCHVQTSIRCRVTPPYLRQPSKQRNTVTVSSSSTMPIDHKAITISAPPLEQSINLLSPLSGSESDRSSDLESIGSYRDTSSPEPEPNLSHEVTVHSELIAYLDRPAPLSRFYRHPVTPDQFWSLFDTSEFRVALEGRGCVCFF